MLIAAGARASQQFKSTWPQLSADTLNLPIRSIPLILGLVALVAMTNATGIIVLSILVAMPAAFRIWIVQCQVPALAPTLGRLFYLTRKNPFTASLCHLKAKHGWSITAVGRGAAQLP